MPSSTFKKLLGLALASTTLAVLLLSAGQSTGETPYELPSQDPTERLEVVLAWARADPPLDRALEVEVWPDGAPGARQSLTSKVPGTLEMPLTTGRWRIAVVDPDFFAEAVVEMDTSALEEKKIELFVTPAARVSAILRPVENATLPSSARLRFETAPRATDEIKSEAVLAGESTCSISARTHLECKAPRGLLDLRLDIPTFAPVYRFHHRVTAHTALGSLTLRPGASLSGWIVAPEGKVELAKTRLTLIEGLETHDAEAQGVRLRETTSQAADSGFFQLTGLQPGHYDLEAKHPSYATTRLEGLSLRQGEETALEPMELQGPSTLVVLLDPPTDPFHARWRLALSREHRAAQGQRVSAREHAAEADGRWRSEALDPGDYRLAIYDSRGHRWASETARLHAGDNRLEQSLPFERLEGLLLLGDEPLPKAEVTLREHRGNMRLSARTDEQGRFFVFLQRDLLWDLDVVLPTQGIEARFLEVAVPSRQPADRWPKKTFNVPSTRVYGQVFHSDGSATSEPTIVQMTAIDRDPPFSLSRLKPLDGFEIRGLEPGRYRISAGFDASSTERRGESRPIEITLEEEVDQGPLRLEIEPGRRLEGQLISERGAPVSGASVFAELETPVGQWLSLSLPSSTSDAEGVFELHLPDSARAVLLTVLAPGHAYHQERLTLPQEDIPPVLISLGAEHGAVQLVVDGDAGDSEDGTLTVGRHLSFLLPEQPQPGAPMRNGLLSLWSQMHSSSAQTAGWLPALPPGSYRACLRTPEAAPFLASLTPLPAAWVERFCGDPGFLTPDGVLELRVPAQPALQSTEGVAKNSAASW